MPAPATSPLVAAFPQLADRLPWRPLGMFPTPVERVAGLVPPAVELWVKREDRSGLRYGGNKVRKLELLLADAAARGKKRLVTVGAYGSNHVLATALYGREAGFAVDAILVPQPLSARVIEHWRIAAHAGARLVPAGSYPGAAWHAARARMARDVYWIPPGGTSPLGVLGHVAAALELDEQVRRGECPRFDEVYVPLGSGGTAAGLWLGLGLGPRAGRAAERVVAVRVVDRLYANEVVVHRWARRARRLLGHLGVASTPDWPALHIEHGFFGTGYAHPTAAAAEAVAQAAACGLHLETTYTGKTLAALLADARSGRLDGRKVLLVDTYNSRDLGPLMPVPADDRLLPPVLARIAAEFERTGT